MNRPVPGKRTSLVFILASLSLLVLAIVVASLGTLGNIAFGQPDPTQQLIQTLSSGVRAQLTQTAQAVIPLTQTALSQPTITLTRTPDATDRAQTLEALVDNRLTVIATTFVAGTINARAAELLTATAANAGTPTATLDLTLRQRTNEAVVISRFTQTADAAAQQTFAAQLNQRLTATALAIASLFPTPTLSEAEQQQTVEALVAGRFTQTAAAALQATAVVRFNENLTATAAAQPTLTVTPTLSDEQFQQTLEPLVAGVMTRTAEARETQAINAFVQATVSIRNNEHLTATAAAFPTATPTVNAQEAQQTLRAFIDTRLTQTAQALAFYGALTATATGQPTLTPTLTPTPGALEVQQTLQAFVDSRLTMTAQAQVFQTVVANNQPTIASRQNAQATATGRALLASLVTGLARIDASNASNLTEIGVLEGHSAEIEAITFSPNGALIASASSDNTVRLWDARTGALSAILRGFTDRRSIAFSPDGRLVASSSSDGTVRLWDTLSGAEVFALRGHDSPVTRVAFSPDGTRLASGAQDGGIILWNTRTGSRITPLDGHTGAITGLQFTSDQLRLVSGSLDTTIRVWELSTGFQLSTLGTRAAVAALAISPDGALIAHASASGIVTLRNAADNTPLATLRGHVGAVNSLAFNADGALLASVGADRVVRVWDVANRAVVATLRGHTGALNSVAFSPDGVRLASAGADNVVRIWAVRAN